jgi:tetratricopeptide (TPR) repeat protein
MEPSRIDFLKQTLQLNPDDAFARYALAMELSQSSDASQAWQHFEHLLTRHPDYSATYFQAGMYLARQGRRDEAREVLKKGVELTASQGNLHANAELQAALEELEEDS